MGKQSGLFEEGTMVNLVTATPIDKLSQQLLRHYVVYISEKLLAAVKHLLL
jgi:hypothetical protein